jgi:Tol biopolymer transport system component
MLPGLVLLLALGAQMAPAQSGYDLYQKALVKERAEGNVEEAIQLYQRIVREFAGNRALAAKAQFRVGLLYERLGRKAEAQRAFQTVVSEYDDQADVVRQAQARIIKTTAGPKSNTVAANGNSASPTVRQIWTLPSAAYVYGTVSHDGRYLPYIDWAVPRGNGELFLHDMASDTNRRVTNDVKNFGQEFAGDGGTFSPDDTQFAYSWFNKSYYEVRIIGLQASGVSYPRVLFSNSEVSRIWPEDWSPDGKWLAVQLQRKDRTAQIGLAAVQDGSLRVLKSVDWRGSSKLFFSPDSKYLAYDLPTTETGEKRDVFVLAIDGSREMPAVVHTSHDVLMGWSPDGRRLLFASDRTGSSGLWSLAFTDGKPQGTPEQIKVDFAGASMGVTSKGALYSFIHYSSFTGVTRSDIQVAAFDVAKGQFLSAPVLAVQAFVGANNFPAWSPDGKYLAFLSRRGNLAQGQRSTLIGILSLDSGQLRELQPQLNIYVGGSPLRWSPDGRSLAIQATDSKGRQGIFRIDATSGEAMPIALSSRTPGGGGESFTNPIWTTDGKGIYYSRFSSAGQLTLIVERDLSSGNEREIIRRSGPRLLVVDLSPDGKYFVAPDGDWFAGPPATPARTRKWNVLLIPVSGGEARELMHGESHGGGILMWAPDSRSVFVYSIRDKSTGDREVWRVSLDDAEPQKLGLNVNFLGPLGNSDQQFHVHPDGKRVAFAAAAPTKPEEVWALENFLLTAQNRKTSRSRR